MVNVEDLIRMLEKFPMDKPVKVLALGSVDDYEFEEIGSVDYACVHRDDEYDEEGNPVFVMEEDYVYIFTEEYSDDMLINGV